ncbi:MAG: threonine ammonia-lyase [Steroidobacteraceae bacterium]|nr:threonine ammonia-lyase [Nevskiaceae bacterium]MCP5339513.1 threonine ammonia-lyase [Nevskiaceae bacterium]MCP5359196.1 threonine ammonia-lyase [Nevskiaceae bacterium]MCP5466429.1 threonine ammonia-lyase [Nevskiaceae bacterium]MCP5471869.1 threonine ammonia-lyase [Nevskiaceae bacterium]
MSLPITLDDIHLAAERVAGHVLDSPFLRSETLSDLTGAEIWLKFENLQFTGSFKQRGALNRLLSLTPAERRRGVVAASAGNHAQGLAYHAAQLGIPATIVMPRTTPGVKAQRTREFGAEVILAGDDFQEAAASVPALIEERGLTLVHAYDDPQVIAGQGTVALEIAATGIELDLLIVPVGGGGLLAGCAVAMHERAPRTRLLGVQSERYPAMALALEAAASGRPVAQARAAHGNTVAEGIGVSRPGALTREILTTLGVDVTIVSEARIEEALALLLQIEKTLVEGAGAAPLAALLSTPEKFRGQRVALVLSGGNVDNRLVMAILQRQLVRERRLFRIAVPIPDQAGSLARLCTAIGELGGNINNVTHDRAFVPRDAKSVQVLVEIEVADAATGPRILARLRELDMPAEDLRGIDEHPH